MSDRSGRLFTLSGTQLATAGLVASMLATAPEAGWPQAAPPPTLGLQSPAQQPVPAQPEPQQIEPLAAAARRESGPDQRNWKTVREIQIAAAAAEEPERGHRRFQRAHQGRRPEPVEHGKALDHGERAGGVSRVRQRRAGLQGRRRPAVPEQGLQGRQEPRHRCGREMLAESVPAGLQAPAGRLQDRKLRDEGSCASSASPTPEKVMLKRIAASVKTQYLTLERLPCWLV